MNTDKVNEGGHGRIRPSIIPYGTFAPIGPIEGGGLQPVAPMGASLEYQLQRLLGNITRIANISHIVQCSQCRRGFFFVGHRTQAHGDI